jgi:hypothetical protein
MKSNGPVRQILRIALLALVLAAQTVTHAHAADHGSPVGKSKCPVCSVAQPAGNAAVDSGRDVTLPAPAPAQFAPLEPLLGTATTPPQHARAPPRPR